MIDYPVLQTTVERLDQSDLDLYQYLIKTPPATYLARASGKSMIGVGIFDKDLLIVDRSLTPKQGDIIVAVIDNSLCCKIYDKNNSRLLSANDHYNSIKFADYQYSLFTCEGVVIHSIRSFF